MNRLKQTLMKLPEYYLMVMVFLYWFSPGSGYINPIAIALMAILVLQAIFKNKVTGSIIAGLFLIANIYMLLALASEFNEFAIINGDAITMVVVGILIFGSNLFISGLMLYKYAVKREAGASENTVSL